MYTFEWSDWRNGTFLWIQSVYVSIGGVANQQTINRLIKGSKHSNVVLAVDNDQAGQDCRDRNPDLTYILPKNKDWNDDLKRGDY